MLRQSTIALGENRGKPRIYLQGSWLAQAGFTPSSRYRVSMTPDRVVIELDNSGTRKVSGKRDNTIPVIDIETAGVTLKADRLQVRSYTNRIEITPAYTVLLVSSRQFQWTEGSLFSGGGFLTAAASKLGYEPKFAIEIDPDYAGIYERNHPSATMFNSGVSEVPWQDLHRFGPLGLLTMGIPCEPYSAIRTLNRGSQQKRDKSLPPEAHDLGDMVFWGLRAVEASNPYTVVIENVPNFLSSGAGYILQAVLRRLGYHVEARIVDPLEYGELTGRKRAVVIAHSEPINWPKPKASGRTLGDILDPEPHEWFDRQTKPWLFNHWDKQTAKGNGFAAQQVTANSRSVGTIKKRYFAGQGDNPVVMHPTKTDTCRWFTLPEVKRLHGIPEGYYCGDSKTTAGEVIGQGVVVSMFEQILDSVIGQRRKAA